MEIREDDLSGPKVRALVALHLSGMRATSPPEYSHALDLSGLQAPDITLWTVWDGDTLLGCGALKALSAVSGEIKSMRTDPAHLRKGVGATLLDHIVSVARGRGYRRLSLETGSGASFEAALALYRRRGFVDGPAFGGYAESTFTRFLHLDL